MSAPLTRTWLWSMPLPPIPQPSHQKNTLTLILTWGTETSAGPLNWASEHRSKKRSSTALIVSHHESLKLWVLFIKKSTFLSCRFKGTLWMSEEHPLSLVEQVTPIIDLMARTSSHFARLRDFVTLKFPPGFPVKIGTWTFLYTTSTHEAYEAMVAKQCSCGKPWFLVSMWMFCDP